MGSQWPGMGKSLMYLEAFRASIMKSEAVLQPLGVKLSQLLMESTAETFNNTLNSFVGIAAIQVNLYSCFLICLHDSYPPPKKKAGRSNQDKNAIQIN